MTNIKKPQIENLIADYEKQFLYRREQIVNSSFDTNSTEYDAGFINGMRWALRKLGVTTVPECLDSNEIDDIANHNTSLETLEKTGAIGMGFMFDDFEPIEHKDAMSYFDKDELFIEHHDYIWKVKVSTVITNYPNYRYGIIKGN